MDKWRCGHDTQARAGLISQNSPQPKRRRRWEGRRRWSSEIFRKSTTTIDVTRNHLSKKFYKKAEKEKRNGWLLTRQW
jgi:hypothetical protein